MEVWGGTAAADNGVTMPGLDAWVYARPFRQDARGGDIHYLSSCATGRVVRLLLADVAGHGSTVADLASRLRNLMRRYLNYADQATLVGAVNRAFGGLAGEGRFATAVVATCWTPTRRISLTNAGHPPPLHYDARRRTWTFLMPEHESARMPAHGVRASDVPRNIPLGIAAADYDEHRLRLGPGDLLLIYTDALLEARAPDNSLLGTGGLLDTLASLDPADPQRLIADLRAAIRAFSSTDEDADDLTIMILRTNDMHPRTSVLTGIRAGARLAADLPRSLRADHPFAFPEITLQNIAGAFLDRLNGRTTDDDPDIT